MARQRKLEVLGLILMAVSALVALAVVTYSARDVVELENIGTWAALTEPSDNRYDNGLGPVGAVVGWGLVGLLGYPVLILLGLTAVVYLRAIRRAGVGFRGVWQAAGIVVRLAGVTLAGIGERNRPWERTPRAAEANRA